MVPQFDSFFTLRTKNIKLQFDAAGFHFMGPDLITRLLNKTNKLQEKHSESE